MSNQEPIPSHISRFILTSIDSVPHLEAVLLLRSKPGMGWDIKTMAQQLFISEKRAGELMFDLCKAGFAVFRDPLYFYEPASPPLKDAMDELDAIYAKNLVAVSRLIHSKMDRQAQKFGDAFRLGEKE